MALAHFLEELVAVLGFWNIIRLAHDIAQGFILGKAAAHILEQIFHIGDADDVIRVVVVDGDAGVPFLHRDFDDLLERIVDLHRKHLRAVRHDVANVHIVKFKNVVDHFLLGVFNHALFLAHIHHHADFLRGDVLLIRVRVEAEQPDHQIGGEGEELYHRLCDFCHKQQGADREEGNLFRLLHGDLFRHKLAEHKGEIRHNQRDDHHRKAADDAVGNHCDNLRLRNRCGELIREGLRSRGGGQKAR